MALELACHDMAAARQPHFLPFFGPRGVAYDVPTHGPPALTGIRASA